jgi:hypothetical protein
MVQRLNMKKYLTFLAMFLVMGLGTVRAQDEQNSPPEDQSQVTATTDSSDQNAPGVARLSYIHGKVSTQRGDNGDWVGVTLNTPVMVGDRVATGDDSKAELQLDWANILRMSSNATVKVANITRNSIQVQVGQGLVTYSVLPNAEATAEIDTPNASIHPTAEGEYRILVNSDGESIAVVRRGGADASTPQGSTHVNEGQMITVQGTDNPQYKIDPAPGRDDWDSWNSDRDHIIDRAEAANRHANRYYVGRQDLDTYGRWEDVPDYGQVWVPNEGPDWVPYREGRWVWEPYYGWTWVSYEPWGWAPYHYGRWFVYDDAWVWWPGPVYAYPAYYPIWSPAYVSFFGWGGGFGIGVGFGWGWGWGHVGWLPCGPGDWFHPWWGRWGGRVNVVNVTNVNITNINNIHNGFAPLGPHNSLHQYSNFNTMFRNNRVRAGFSSMEGSQFGRAAVPTHQQPISTSTLRNVGMSAGKMPISPSHESYSPTGRGADPASYRHAPSNSQRFFAASRATGSPNSLSARGSASFASRPTTSTARPATNFNGARAGNSFERPSSTLNSRANANASVNAERGSAPITSSRPGWHTFSPPSSANTGRRAASNSRATSTPMNSSSNRGAFNAPSDARSSGIQGSWQHFDSAPRSSQPENRSFSSPSRTFEPPRSSSRGYSNNSTGGYHARPSVNMRQPIVTPRNNDGGYGSYGARGYGRGYGGGYGYGAPRPSSSQPRPSYSAPPSYSSPRSHSAPRGNSGGGDSAPHGGSSGGGSRGGGGGHPSGGGNHGHGR